MGEDDAHALRPQGRGNNKAARSASAPAALVSEAAADENSVEGAIEKAALQAAADGVAGGAAGADAGGNAGVQAGRRGRRVVRPKLEAGSEAQEAARPPALKRRKRSAPAGAALAHAAETAQLAGQLERGAPDSQAGDAAIEPHTPAACAAEPVSISGCAAAPAQPDMGSMPLQTVRCSITKAEPVKQQQGGAVGSRHGLIRDWRRRKTQPAAAHAGRLD